MPERRYWMEIELNHLDVSKIEGYADTAHWDMDYVKIYYDRLRRKGNDVRTARHYTMARARNLAEQWERRRAHGTGAT